MEKKKNPWVKTEELTLFEQCMLKKDSIDLDEIDSLPLTALILKNYQTFAIVDLVIDFHFVHYKRLMEAMKKKTLTESEVIELAKTEGVTPKAECVQMLLGKNDFNVEQLSRLSHDIALIDKLQTKGIVFCSDDIKRFMPNIRIIKELSKLPNIKLILLREQLNEMGLEDYTRKVIVNNLGAEDYLYLGKIFDDKTDDLTIDKIYAKMNVYRKIPIKKVIKKYQKSIK